MKQRKHTGKSLYKQVKLKIIYGTNPVWEIGQIPAAEYRIAQKIRNFIKTGKPWGVAPNSTIKKARAKTFIETPLKGILEWYMK